jgi:hypothetical protein
MEPQQVADKGGSSENSEAIRERNLPGHLEHPSTDGQEEQPQDQGGGASNDVMPGPDAADPQLDRALELLKSWNVFKTVVAQTQP